MEGKINVLFPNTVVDYLDELSLILYNKNYFSYKSSASDYVLKIYDFIENNISKFPNRITPIELKYLARNIFFTNPIKKQFGISFLKILKVNTQ